MDQEELDHIAAETLLEAWRYELSDIRHADTWYIYLGMFGMAESVHQLERLHESLPENMQLLRRHFIRLKEFWQHCFADKRKERREVILKSLLFALTWGNGEDCVTASKYYVTMIRERDTRKPPAHFSGGQDGKGYFFSDDITPPLQKVQKHFFAKLFGVKTRVEFRLTQDRKHMLAVLIFRETELTEKITHQITDVLPPYFLFKYGMADLSTEAGVHLNVSYEYETEKILEDITEENGVYQHKSIALISTQNFLVSVAELLRNNGIPVVGDLTIEKMN